MTLMAPSWTWQARVWWNVALCTRCFEAAEQSLQTGMISECQSENRIGPSVSEGRDFPRLSPGSEDSENFHGYALYVLNRVVVRRIFATFWRQSKHAVGDL